MSFQLALPTECIRQIFRFSNCFNSFNSHSLRSVSSTSAVYNSIYHLSTRARYGAYLGKQHEYIREVHLSTRILYGVYLRSFFFTCGIFSFQLAPSTECILTQHSFQLFHWISTRTLYGVYPLLLASVSYTQDFNSHPLRSVSNQQIGF